MLAIFCKITVLFCNQIADEIADEIINRRHLHGRGQQECIWGHRELDNSDQLSKTILHGNHLLTGDRSLFAVDSGSVQGDEDADRILGEVQDQIIAGATFSLKVALLNQFLHRG